ncbi:MAG: aspartate aminotransferase family protein [Granulosicoccus sp.]
MSHVFARHTQTEYPVAVGGKGCYLIDQHGKRYLDGSGGAAVSCLGHGDSVVLNKIKSQLDKLAYAHTSFFTSEPAEKLADRLIKLAPGELDRAYFVSSGSEAVESAIKLARQYFIEIGEPGRSKIIARQQSYHGNTLGALAAGGNQWRREPFYPLLTETTHISPCYPYRGQQPDESKVDYGLRVANELEQAIKQIGADQVMAFIAEPVVGATLGAVVAVPGYFKRIRDICDQYGVLLILDEVMCGMGRTGSLFACEQEGISPDILTIAKGLGAGYQPIGAMLCTDSIYTAIEQGSGFFQHGHTYLGHPVACATGLAVLDTIEERNLVACCQQQGAVLSQLLHERFSEHPSVGDIRGRGLFQGLELVKNRNTKAAYAPSLRIAAKVKSAAQDAGLICYPMSGTVDGRQGDHILLAPPYIINESEISELVDKLSIAIHKATRAA